MEIFRSNHGYCIHKYLFTFRLMYYLCTICISCIIPKGYDGSYSTNMLINDEVELQG